MVRPWFTASLLEGYPHRAEARKTRKTFQIVETHFGPLLSHYQEVTGCSKKFNRTAVISNFKSQIQISNNPKSNVVEISNLNLRSRFKSKESQTLNLESQFLVP